MGKGTQLYFPIVGTTLLVGIGAGLGALLRFCLSTLTGPLSLIFINALGSFVMGYAKPGPFLGTGLLGGFTSFSAYALYSTGSFTHLWLTAVLCVGGWLLGNRLSR